MVLPALGAPLLGVWVDRLPRKPILVWGNLASAAAVLPLVLVRDEGDVWLIWVVAFLYGVSFVVLPAAVNGLLKELLPEDLLVDANSGLATFKEGFRLFGPLVGAAIFATAGGWLVAVVDAATFVVAAAFIATIRVTEAAPRPGTGFRDEVGAGLRFLVGDRVLRNVLIGMGASILVIGFFESSIYALIDAFDKAPTFAGILLTVQGVGAIAGGVTASLVVRRLGEVAATVVGLATMAFSTAVVAAAPDHDRGLRRRGLPAGSRSRGPSSRSPRSCSAAPPATSSAGCRPRSTSCCPPRRPSRSRSGRCSSACSTTAPSSGSSPW